MLRGRGPVSVYLYGCYELILCTYSRCSGLYFNGGLNIYIRIVVFRWIWTYSLAFYMYAVLLIDPTRGYKQRSSIWRAAFTLTPGRHCLLTKIANG